MGKRYIAYEIQNEQPVLIANLDISKPGEIATLQYLPGSTLRGMVIANLKEKMEDEDSKQKILTKAMFLNGYPMSEEGEMLPSPKGFYEDKKQEGALINIVAEPDKDMGGHKRADLGHFCIWKKKTIYFTSVERKDALNNHVRKKDIFRKNVLAAGQKFRAYIAVEEGEKELYHWLTDALEEQIVYIGSSRTSGFGKCRVYCRGEITPYQNVACATGNQNEIYLYLASNMSMRDEQGEICGIDLDRLAELLEAGKLTLEASSTSVCKTSGVNRTWGCRTPEIVMYEAGSVFKLKAEKSITEQARKRVCENGIGVKREEGCGQILFLRDYEKLDQKKQLLSQFAEIKTETILSKTEEKEQIEMVAKEIAKKRIEKAMERYVAEHGVDRRIPGSQRGIMLNHAKYARVEGMNSVGRMEKYLAHEKEKLQQDKRQGDNQGKKMALDYLERMIRQDIFEKLDIDRKAKVCGIPVSGLFTKEELQAYQMKLLEKVLVYENRRRKGSMA